MGFKVVFVLFFAVACMAELDFNNEQDSLPTIFLETGVEEPTAPLTKEEKFKLSITCIVVMSLIALAIEFLTTLGDNLTTGLKLHEFITNLYKEIMIFALLSTTLFLEARIGFIASLDGYSPTYPVKKLLEFIHICLVITMALYLLIVLFYSWYAISSSKSWSKIENTPVERIENAYQRVDKAWSESNMCVRFFNLPLRRRYNTINDDRRFTIIRREFMQQWQLDRSAPQFWFHNYLKKRARETVTNLAHIHWKAWLLAASFTLFIFIVGRARGTSESAFITYIVLLWCMFFTTLWANRAISKTLDTFGSRYKSFYDVAKFKRNLEGRRSDGPSQQDGDSDQEDSDDKATTAPLLASSVAMAERPTHDMKLIGVFGKEWGLEIMTDEQPGDVVEEEVARALSPFHKRMNKQFPLKNKQLFGILIQFILLNIIVGLTMIITYLPHELSVRYSPGMATLLNVLSIVPIIGMMVVVTPIIPRMVVCTSVGAMAHPRTVYEVMKKMAEVDAAARGLRKKRRKKKVSDSVV